MIDSGSVSTFIHRTADERLKLYIIPKRKSVTSADPNQTALIVGEVFVDITLNNSTHSGVVIEVIDKHFIDLFIGKDVMRRYNKVTFPFDGPNDKLILGAIPDKLNFPAMKVPPPHLFTNLSENIKPVTTKSCHFTQPDSKFINEETAHLLKEGVIEPSISPWRAQVLVTKNNNHKRRMVVDYSNTINIYTELDAYPMQNIPTMVNNIAQYNLFSTLDLKSAYHQIAIKEEDWKYTAFAVDNRLYRFTLLPFGRY